MTRDRSCHGTLSRIPSDTACDYDAYYRDFAANSTPVYNSLIEEPHCCELGSKNTSILSLLFGKLSEHIRSKFIYPRKDQPTDLPESPIYASSPPNTELRIHITECVSSREQTDLTQSTCSAVEKLSDGIRKGMFFKGWGGGNELTIDQPGFCFCLANIGISG